MEFLARPEATVRVSNVRKSIDAIRTRGRSRTSTLDQSANRSSTEKLARDCLRHSLEASRIICIDGSSLPMLAKVTPASCHAMRSNNWLTRLTKHRSASRSCGDHFVASYLSFTSNRAAIVWSRSTRREAHTPRLYLVGRLPFETATIQIARCLEECDSWGRSMAQGDIGIPVNRYMAFVSPIGYKPSSVIIIVTGAVHYPQCPSRLRVGSDWSPCARPVQPQTLKTSIVENAKANARALRSRRPARRHS